MAPVFFLLFEVPSLFVGSDGLVGKLVAVLITPVLFPSMKLLLPTLLVVFEGRLAVVGSSGFLSGSRPAFIATVSLYVLSGNEV